MFLTKEEQVLTEEYLQQGYVIRPVANQKALESIRQIIYNLAEQNAATKKSTDVNSCLNHIHESITVEQLNDFRLKIIRGINAESEFRERYFNLARPYLDTLVGNELSMQLRVNLSVQLPGDESSLLPVHADTWSGDSPYEVVVWLPLVDYYNTKSMYFLPPKAANNLSDDYCIY